ncbi:sterol desaturase family protein [Eionea flava]
MIMLIEYYQQFIDGFLNPQKRLFVGCLAFSLIAAFVWLLWVKRFNAFVVIKALFSKAIWWSPSARIDYQLMLLNRLLMLFLSPYLLAQLSFSGAIFYTFYELFPARPLFLTSWSDTSIALLFSLLYFVVDDFFRFFTHFLMHRVPLLWVFHKVHHSAETLNPFTVLRTHPVEGIIFTGRTVLVQSIMIASAVFFLGDRVSLFTVLGANIFVVVFNTLGANLRHSHIALNYPRWLERFFLSPAQHHIHHSVAQRHRDKNFGVALACWDRWFFCFHYSENTRPLTFGLSQSERMPQTLRAIYFSPLVESVELLKNYSSFIVRYRCKVGRLLMGYRKVKKYYSSSLQETSL